MAKKINIVANLIDKQFKKQLADIENGKYKVDVDVDGEKIGDTSKTVKRLGNTTASTNSEFKKLKDTISNTFSAGKIAMTGYLFVLNAINKAGQNAKQTIKDLDESITNLSVAMGEGRNVASNYLSTLNEQAKEIGATTKETANSADSWIRQGKSLAETEKLVYDSMILSKLGKIESADASTYLTAALNGYKLEAESAIDVVDKLTAVDMESASDAGGLAESLSKTSSAANMAGVSFNKLIGMIATVKEVTQDSDESVGNMFKSIFSRMNQIKAGKFVDLETGESLNDTEKVLNNVGISMRNANNEFISSEKILDEVGAKWKGFDSTTQRAVATAIAGTYQYNRLIALFDNYGDALKYTETAANSAGTAIEKFNDSYMNSLEAKENTLQASFESMVINSDFSEVYAGILDATTALVDFINETNVLKDAMSALAVGGAIKAFVGIKSGINQAYITLNKFQNAMSIVGKTKISTKEYDRLLLLSNGLSQSQMKLIVSTNALSIAQKKELLMASGLSEEESILQLKTWKMTAANNGLTTSTTSANNAFKALWTTIKANPLLLIISSVTLGISVWQKYKQSIEDAVSAASEAASIYKEQTSSIDEMVSKYQDLRGQLIAARGNEEATYDIKQQLLELQKQLNEQFGEEYENLNLVTNAYKDQTEEIKAYNKEVAQKYLNENRKGINEASKQMESDDTYYLGSMNGLVNASELQYLDAIQSIASANNIDFTDRGFEFVGNAKEASESINNFMNQITKLQKQAGNTSTVMSSIFDGLLDNSGEALADAESIIDEYSEIYRQSQLAEIASDTNLSSEYSELLDAVTAYNDAVTNSENQYDDENVRNAYDNLQIVKQGIDDNEKEWGKYADVVEEAYNKADISAYSFYDSIDKNKDSIGDLANELKGLSDVDLQSMTSDGDNEDAFDKLCNEAGKYGLEVQDVIDLLVELGYVQGKVQNTISAETDIFSSFANTDFGERIQHITDLFNEGSLTHKQYFDALQSEIDNFDASNFTDSIEDMNKASEQFFVSSVQQTASGLSDLINSFDSGEMSVSEYLEGYLAIGNTLSTLADDLQENSAAWNENGEAISSAENAALDETQAKLANAIATIQSYQDSIYSIEQIMSNSVAVGSEEFSAHAQVIAQDLYNIVQTGGLMADEIKARLGSTTSEIAQSLTENVANQELACEAIMNNTNNAITNMATAIGDLFDTLGSAISNFKVDISFGIKSIDWKKVNILGKDINLPEINFELGASGESLASIGSAVSSFGKTIASNISSQITDMDDYHFGSTDAAKDRNYTPSSGITKNYEDAMDNIKDSTKSATDAAEEEFEELFNFFERRVTVLDNALSLLNANLENVTGSFAKNQLLSAEQNLNAEKINNYTDALAMYAQKANEALAKLPTDIAEKIQNGAVDLTTFIGDGNKEVVEAIKDYQDWADKVSDCKQQLAELKEEIRQLELEKFNNIVDDFTNQFDIRDDSISLIDKQIALLEEAGQLIGSSFYTTQIDQSKKQLATLEEEKTKLVEQLNAALSSGKVEKGTDEWLEMVGTLSDVESSMLDCKKSIEEFDNALLELHTEVFERIQEQFSNLDSELENIIGLFDDYDVANENGEWTKEGIAQLGLLAQQYELAEYQVQQYNDEIQKLNDDYLNGRYSATEYADKLAELTSAQWEAVNASEAAKDAIMDLNEARVDKEIEGIEKEIDAYKELIDAQIEALKSAKDLHDYQESIAEKTKSVTDLERQIAAMANDDSAATVAKRKQLEEELAEAKKELEEAQYDHSIETQEDALNKEYDRFEQEKNDEIEALQNSLNEREALIAESFETVKNNADTVGQEIALIAQQHGITISDAIVSSWQSGELSIASYGEVLSSNTSAFIGNLMGVENEVLNLQLQADNTASSLSIMFSTKADTLVNDLITSYSSASNLNTMTNALKESLVNTLERGYNVSGITSALDSIASAANGAASAASGAAKALADLGAAQTDAASNKYGNEFYYVNKNGDRTYIGTSGYVPKTGNTISKYASGTRSAKGGLSITDEEGYELKLPKLANGNYTITGEGDQILTKSETDNIFDWSKINPSDFIELNIPNAVSTAPDFSSIVPVNAGNNVSLHYDSLVTVNGDVNDTNHFLQQVTAVAHNQIVDFQKDLAQGVAYGNGLNEKWRVKQKI